MPRPRPPRRLLAAGLLLLLLLPLDARPGLAARDARRAHSPEHGLSVFVFGEPATTERDLRKVRAIGFPWAKSLFRWADIEGAHKGAYRWDEADRVVRAVAAAGLKLLARLDFQPAWARADGARNGPPDDYRDYADFARAFAARYGDGSPVGRVHAIQVWNEPNLAREWGDRPVTREDAAEYVSLLAMAHRAIKEAAPDIAVVSAGLALGAPDPACCQPDDRYLEWLFEAGLRGHYDALGLNANVECPCVEAAPGSVPGFPDPSAYFRRVERLREIMVDHGDGDRQVWLTEFGWPGAGSGPGGPRHAVSEEDKGELIVQALQFARERWAPWIGVMALWTLANPSWDPGDGQDWDDEQATWAVTDPDGSDRPAYARLQRAWRDRELRWQRNGPP